MFKTKVKERNKIKISKFIQDYNYSYKDKEIRSFKVIKTSYKYKDKMLLM